MKTEVVENPLWHVTLAYGIKLLMAYYYKSWLSQLYAYLLNLLFVFLLKISKTSNNLNDKV
jgi:hypothetical protein